MKYCAYCGKELLDEALICSGCGCPTDLYHKQNTQTQQTQVNQQPQTNVPLSTNTFAVLSLIFAFLSPILGIIFGKIGLNEIRKNKNQKGEDLAKAGLILSIIFLILGVLIAIGVVIVVFVILAIAGSDVPSEDYNEGAQLCLNLLSNFI